MNIRDKDRQGLEPPPDGLEALPRVMHPRRDLWPAIEARLEQRSAQPAGRVAWRRPALALAASLLLMVAAGLLLTERGPAPGPQMLAAEPPTSGLAGAEPDLLAAVMVTEREYQAAFSAMAPLQVYIDSPPAGPSDELQRSWAKMQRTENGLLAALNEYPDNPFLAQKLIDLRTRQLAFMRQVFQLDQDYGRST